MQAAARGTFVAATLIAIDFEKQLIEIWIGGNPPLCILGERGNVLHFARARAPERSVWFRIRSSRK